VPARRRDAGQALARLDAALGESERVLLDSSALIAFHQPAELAHPLARRLLERIGQDADPLTGFYSMVTAAELLVRPIRAGIAELGFMHAFLTSYPNLHGLPMDLHVAQQAATLRVAVGLRLPDAIVVASGLLAGCEAIVTNDGEWRKRLAPRFRQFRWVCLSEL
jgi:predicted nucleic acid-binding protein